jgi:hypothetical protein
MRTKIIAGNLAAVLVVGLVSYALVKSNLEAKLVEEVDSRIALDFRILERSFRLSARELAELVDDQAAARQMVDIFVSTLDEAARRTRGYEAAERTATWLADPSRRGAVPDIVVVIDDTGRVVARNADRNRMYQQDLASQVPVVRAALQGDSATGIWRKQDENKVLQVAAAPIRAEGRVVGVLLVGYDLSNGLARAEGSLLGRDVAFVLDDRVYSSSLEQGAASEALRAYLHGEVGRPATTAALEQGAISSPFQLQLGSDQYLGVIGPAPSGGSNARLAMVVLANRSAQLAKASATDVILILMVVGALVVVAYGFAIGNSFLRPVEQMEEGILAVINGQTDLRLDIQSAEFGGLAYRINQLLNVFTGTPEEDEQGRVSQPPSQRWQDDSMAQSLIEGGPAEAPSSEVGSGGDARAGGKEGEDDPELAARLAAEPEDTYYPRVYREYVAAKQAVGEDVSNISQDKFVQRLKANEQSLIKKHGCRMVRFQVQTVGTQVNLKPVIIR